MRSGFVALIGRPNVGKSTLVNRVLGRKVSITSDVYGTTRHRILGVWHAPELQVVLVDTPGLQPPRDRLGERMARTAIRALSDADLRLHVVEAGRTPGPDELAIARRLRGTVLLVVNKADRVDDAKLWIQRYEPLYAYAAAHAVSALNGRGVEALMADVAARLPEGPPYFPPDAVTDRPDEFLAGELVREAVHALTRDEIPHHVAVRVESSSHEGGIWRIGVHIIVDRASQKPILLGARGERIKAIGTRARLAIEEVFATRVFLSLWVQVRPGWRDRDGTLESLERDERATWND